MLLEVPFRQEFFFVIFLDYKKQYRTLDMKTLENKTPQIVVKSIAFGLILMAIFTMLWTGIAESGLNGKDFFMVGIIFNLCSLLFLSYGIYLFIQSKKFPKNLSEKDKDKGKKMWKVFGFIFGLEGLLIAVSVVVLSTFDLQNYVVPIIALIVGLHFYPMAKIFERKIDYYLATWVTLVAILGIVLVIGNKSESMIFAAVGVGVALATISYGIFMITEGRKILKTM